jgi:hypothetical protein
MTRSPSIALLLVGCALLSACGSSSESSSSAYVARGEAICAHARAELARYPRPTTPEQAIAYIPHALTIIYMQGAQLSALDPAPSKRSQLDAAIATDRHISAVLSHFLSTLKTGIVELTSFVQVQTQTNALHEQLDRQYRAAGLPTCAK